MRDAVIFNRSAGTGELSEKVLEQTRLCHEYAQENGLNVKAVLHLPLVGGLGGESVNYLKKKVSEGVLNRGDTLITPNLSRFTRNPEEMVNFLGFLDSNGISYVKVIGLSPDDFLT